MTGPPLNVKLWINMEASGINDVLDIYKMGMARLGSMISCKFKSLQDSQLTIASPGTYVKVIGSLRTYSVSKPVRKPCCKHMENKWHTVFSSPYSTGTKVTTGNECKMYKGPEWDHLPHVRSGTSSYAAFWKGRRWISPAFRITRPISRTLLHGGPKLHVWRTLQFLDVCILVCRTSYCCHH